MSFALFELADNPDIQAKARREIETVLARNDGKFTYESISEMNYLNQIFNGIYASIGGCLLNINAHLR